MAMTDASRRIRLSNVQPGFAEVYLPEDDSSFGYVERRDVRTRLDLETGNETVVRRWFAYNDGIPVGECRRMYVGYPTRSEALDALEADMIRDAS